MLFPSKMSHGEELRVLKLTLIWSVTRKGTVSGSSQVGNQPKTKALLVPGLHLAQWQPQGVQGPAMSDSCSCTLAHQSYIRCTCGRGGLWNMVVTELRKEGLSCETTPNDKLLLI